MRIFFAVLLLLSSSLTLAQLPKADSSTGFFNSQISEPEFLPVEEAYQLHAEVQSEGAIRLNWQIADSYYLYQHRFAFSLEDSQGAIELTHQLQPGLQRTDEYFGEVEVYYLDADITLYPQRATDRGTLMVASQGCADAGLCYPPQKEYFDVDFTTGLVTPTGAPGKPAALKMPASEPGSTAATASTLIYMLMLAFLGGSILNLMPCVFPILSLKVLSFARTSDRDRHLHGWLYSAGVVVSFVFAAAVLMALQHAGQAIGWGFQLQSPGFVIALAYLFVAMGLSLSGLVEFGGGMMNTGSSLADSGGRSGSFFTGVLAVIVASPCTAPFMGTALGFALTQPPYVALLVFAALGAGMAAPMLLLGYSSTLRDRMPKPGAWMETLKQILAFPLYATAIWLIWVAGRQTGVDTMAVALSGALLLALGLWLWRYGDWRRGLAVVSVVAALGLASWRGMDATSDTLTSMGDDTVAWSEQRLQALRDQGQPVFVDVTADWCITCIANEQAVLFTDTMTAAFATHGVTYMVADWTNYDADIAEFLRQHGRYGIPLYVMYTANPSDDPIVLPQILTSSMVLEALEIASSSTTVAALAD